MVDVVYEYSSMVPKTNVTDFTLISGALVNILEK